MGWLFSWLNSVFAPPWTIRHAQKHRRTLTLEDLEGRRLLSQGVQPVFTLPNAITSNIISGPDRDLWFSASTNPTGFQPEVAIDRIGPSGSVTSFPVPTNGATSFTIFSVAAGPNGNVWFDAGSTQPNSDEQQVVVIGQVTPSGIVTEFPAIPVPALDGAESSTIVSGPEGDLWFDYELNDFTLRSSESQNFIGRITTEGKITLFPVSSFSSKTPVPMGPVAVGADGNLWFTAGGNGPFVFGRMTPSGAVTQLSFPKVKWVNLGNGPGNGLIASGPIDSAVRQVYSVSAAGTVTRDKIPAAVARGILNYLGPADGSLWFSDDSKLLELDRITASGVVTSYRFLRAQNAYGEAMAVGGDGNLYVLVSFFGKGENTPATLYRVSPSELVPVR